MVKGKVKSTIWITPAVKEQIEASYRADNCGSQSDFVEKAVEFYLGYLNAQKAGEYLPYMLSETLDAKLGVLGDRIGRLLFKMTVEESMMMHIIASDTDVDAPTLDRLRGRCVQDAKRTNGEISFKEILKFQKGL